MTGTVKINHIRWRYHVPTTINESRIILENEDTHVEDLEIEVYHENKLMKTIHVGNMGDVHVKEVDNS